MSFEIRSFNESAGGAIDGPEDGVYNAVIKSVEDPEFWAFPDASLSPEQLEAQKKWVTRFVFEIEDDPEWAGHTLRTKRINFTTLHEKSKNYELWKALMGDGFDPDYKYRPSESPGHRCQIIVKVKDNGYSDITGFLPIRQKRGARSVNQQIDDVDSIPF